MSPDLWKELIEIELEDLFGPKEIGLWWDIPMAYLNNKTPRTYFKTDPEGLYNKVCNFGR